MNTDVVPVPSDVDVEYIMAAQRAAEEKAREKSKDQQFRDAITHALGRLGELVVQDDALIFSGEKWVIPAQYEGRLPDGIRFLQNHDKQDKQTFNFSRTMPYRPYDGAHAFMTVMKNITGTTGFGVTKFTMFGPKHPEFKSINTDYDRTEQVPWGAVAFPAYDAEFNVSWAGSETGPIFQLGVEAPRKWRKHIEAIFQLVESHLRGNSIYRGKAIAGAEWPDFINPDLVDPADVVYSEAILAQLTAHVWAPIRHSEAMRRQRLPLNRKVLLAGPYGTGKSLAGMLTAQEAVRHGWTYIICRVGKDNPADVLRLAELYTPAVVVIEDIDVHAAGESAMDISRLLEMLDGIQGKGKEVVALFTTNKIEEIQKGALRPGRIDAVIEVSYLDATGFRKLITRTLGEAFLDVDVDWEAVSYAFREFLPAFVKEAATRAQRFVMARNAGVPGVITTEDLCLSADSLRPQLERMNGAAEGARRKTIDDQVVGLVEGVLSRTSISESYGESMVVRERTINDSK